MIVNIKSILIILSLILYSLSLYFPAFGCNYFGAGFGQYAVSAGFRILIFGWIGPLVLNFSWFANITYFITLFLIPKNSPKVLFLAITTFILGLSSLLLYFANAQKIGLYVGFYFWLSSFLMLIIYGILNLDFVACYKLSEPPRYTKTILIIYISILFLIIFTLLIRDRAIMRVPQNISKENNYPGESYSPLKIFSFSAKG